MDELRAYSEAEIARLEAMQAEAERRHALALAAIAGGIEAYRDVLRQIAAQQGRT